MAEKPLQPDYRHLSYNEMCDLIVSLYKEIDRLTAERKASTEALDRLSNNLTISSYTIERIKDGVKKTVEETIIAMRKVRATPVKTAKRKK